MELFYFRSTNRQREHGQTDEPVGAAVHGHRRTQSGGVGPDNSDDIRKGFSAAATAGTFRKRTTSISG